MSVAASPDSSTTESDPLNLETLDSESLFKALTNVEMAIPEILLSIKPILSHLVSPPEIEESGGILARKSVEKYMNTLDKIQYILRQTVYYLHEIRASPSTLTPPSLQSIPTPFASTLPKSSDSAIDNGGEEDERPQLGLYGSRVELRVLRDMRDSLRRLREIHGVDGRVREPEEGVVIEERPGGAGVEGETIERREEVEEDMIMDDEDGDDP